MSMQTYKNLLIAGAGALLLAGCALFHQPSPTTLRLHEEITSTLPDDDVRLVAVPKTGLKIPLNPYATLSERDVARAELAQTPGGATIKLQFDANGAILFDEMTTRCRGQYIVTFLNERPVAAWLVDRRVTNGQFVVEGDFTDEEARKAVEALNKISQQQQAR
jgi:preprotein translocase subunit SecD